MLRQQLRTLARILARRFILVHEDPTRLVKRCQKARLSSERAIDDAKVIGVYLQQCFNVRRWFDRICIRTCDLCDCSEPFALDMLFELPTQWFNAVRNP